MPSTIEILPPKVGLFHTTTPVLSDEIDDKTQTYQILKGGMWPSQKLWWELPNFVRMFVAGYGCIHGGAEIRLNRAGKGFRMPLHKVVERFNGKSKTYAWDPTIPTFVQRRMPDGTIRLGKLKNAWCSGVKDTYTITTKSWTTRATAKHPFLTEKGWKKLSDLREGDRVYVFDEDRKRGVSEKKVYIHRKAGVHPYRKPTGVVAEHRLVYEASLNGLSYDEFLRRLKKQRIKGLKFLDPTKVAVHHKNGNHRDNRLENLEAHTHHEHAVLHGGEHASNVLFKSKLESIKSIDYYGEEMTYDLEVDDNPHNFIADGFVVHNTGKTIQHCKRMISLAIHNAPVPVASVSPTYSVAEQTLISTYVDLLTSIQSWLDHWRRRNLKQAKLEWRHLRKSPQEFHITYHEEGKRSMRGVILVYSGEDPNRLKGPNLAAAGIDEPFIQDWAVFDQMVVRCRHPRARRREINLTGTPEQINWGYDLAEGDLSHKYDVGVVQASTLENKALPLDYIERLKEAWDPKVAQAYLHGLFVNLSAGLVYYSFDRNENVVELPMPKGAIIGCGMDFNVNPMAATMFWAIPSGTKQHIHYFDEIELPNSDTQDMCALLRETYGKPGLKNTIVAPGDHYYTHEPLEVVYPDSNAGRSTSAPGGKTDYDYIRAAGFEVERDPKGNGLRRDRFNAVNNLLRPTNGRVRMTVSPRCKKLIKYQMLYSHELMLKQKGMSHLLDARDYPVCRLFPADRESLKLKSIKGI